MHNTPTKVLKTMSLISIPKVHRDPDFLVNSAAFKNRYEKPMGKMDCYAVG
jgi:hypothetical protein